MTTYLIILASVAAANPQPLITSGDLQEIGYSSYWEAHLPLSVGEAVKDAFLVDDAIYVTTSHGTLFALQAETGLIRWAEKLCAPEYTIHRPTHLFTPDGRGPTLVMTSSAIFVLDRYAGDVLHQANPIVTATCSPVGALDMIFLGGTDGRFYSYRLTSLAPNGLIKRWEVELGGIVSASPTIYAGNRLLLASENGSVYSCFARDKTFNWKFDTGGAILGDPAVDDTGIYVSSTNRSIYKLSAGGKVMWRVRHPCDLIDGPIAAADTVYQRCAKGGLTALDAATGNAVWRRDRGDRFLVHFDGRDFVLTTSSSLEVIDTERSGGESATAVVVASLDLPNVSDAITNVHDAALYLLGKNGRVVCGRPIGEPYLRAKRVDAAQLGLSLPPSGDRSAEATTNGKAETDTGEADDPLRSRHDAGP